VPVGSGDLQVGAQDAVALGSQRLRIGYRDQLGATFVARRENEPQYYVLDPKAVSELRQTAADVKPAPPTAKKK